MVQPSSEREKAREQLRNLAHDHKWAEGRHKDSNHCICEREEVLDLDMACGCQTV